MKYHLFSLSFFLSIGVMPLLAQYDDLYYEPADYEYISVSYTPSYDGYAGNGDSQAYGSDYDGAYYDYEEDYYDDFDYTRRIIRFRRPVYVSNFYQPYYNPYIGYSPVVVNVTIGRPYSYYTTFYNPWRYNPYNRYTDWSYNYNPYAWNSYYSGWNGGPYVVNNYYGGGYYGGYNNYGNVYGCPPSFYTANGGSALVRNTGVNGNSYYGRRSEISTTSTRGIYSPTSARPTVKTQPTDRATFDRQGRTHQPSKVVAPGVNNPSDQEGRISRPSGENRLGSTTVRDATRQPTTTRSTNRTGRTMDTAPSSVDQRRAATPSRTYQSPSNSSQRTYAPARSSSSSNRGVSPSSSSGRSSSGTSSSGRSGRR